MKIWFLAIRPKTLVAAIMPVLVGVALVTALKFPLHWHLVVCTLLSAIFIQIATNLFNDAIDFKKGTDTDARLGPTRVTQAGLFTPKQVLLGGFVCAGAALLFGIPLVIAGGWVILAIGLFSLLFAYLYTGGPYPLAYVGLAEIFVILFFGLIAVGGTFFVQTGVWPLEVIVAGLQVGCLATVLLAVNNLRDVVCDKQAGRKTLPVRFGIRAARFEICLLLVTPFLLNLFWWRHGFDWAAVLPLIAAPFAYEVGRGVAKMEPGSIYNYFLARAALTQFNFGGMLAVGFFWS